jgi:predicted Zn-dependent peptidase
VLDEHLPQAADVLRDLIFAPLLRASDLELERKVVLEEIAMVDDAPDDIVFELHNELLWGPHPLGYSILGTRASVGAMRLDDLRALHARAYRPEHLVLSAAGHVEHEALIDVLLRTGWGETARGVNAAPAAPRAVAPVPERRHVQRDTAQCHVVLGAPSLPYLDPRRYALTLLSAVLGGGMSSRLFQRVREERGLAYSIYAFHHHYSNTGMHGVYLATSPEQVDEALEFVTRELRDVTANGLPADELEMGKSQLKGQITLSLESPGARLYRAAATELYGEPFRALDELLLLVDAITASEVAEIGYEFFSPERMTVLTLGPTTP